MVHRKNYSDCIELILLLVLSCLLIDLRAQSEHQNLLSGTDAYLKEDFETAQSAFESATKQNDASFKGHFNLGNSYFRNKNYTEAIQSFQKALTLAEDSEKEANAYYNLGNTFLSKAQQNQSAAPSEKSAEDLPNAIEAYKNALRLKPNDFEAKNNLANAYKLLRMQQQQQQQQQNKQEQKDNNKDDQEASKPQDDQSQSEKDAANKSTNSNKKLNKDELDRLMDIIEQEDKKVQEKLMKRKQTNKKTKEKDW